MKQYPTLHSYPVSSQTCENSFGDGRDVADGNNEVGNLANAFENVVLEMFLTTDKTINFLLSKRRESEYSSLNSESYISVEEMKRLDKLSEIAFHLS